MKISLITATYNSSTTIRDTLLSVNSQDYAHIEHIVMDGGSKDDTVALCERLGDRIAYCSSRQDEGFYDAWNKGLGIATGEVVGFINSDDYYVTHNVISDVMTAFHDRDIDAVHADLVYVNRNRPNIIERYWKSEPITHASLQQGFIPAHPTVFFRRAVYEKIGAFDLRYRLAADYDLLLRAFYRYNVPSIYVPKVWVRMRSGGTTGGGVRSILAQNTEIRTSQQRNGLYCSAVGFYSRKLVDRLKQRVRGLSVAAPDLDR